MPKRLLRDWTDSETVSALSAEAERLFVRIIMKADDYGRYTADPRLLRASLFPLTIDQIRESDISTWLSECSKELIRQYVADAKPYLVIVRFGQRLRDSKAKFPDPPPDIQEELRRVAASRGELRPETGCGDGFGDGVHPTDVCLESASPLPAFPCVGPISKWILSPKKLAEWQESFPDLDVLGECRKARQWCVDTPKRRKTASGMARFLGSWLGRTQNEGRGHKPEQRETLEEKTKRMLRERRERDAKPV